MWQRVKCFFGQHHFAVEQLYLWGTSQIIGKKEICIFCRRKGQTWVNQ